MAFVVLFFEHLRFFTSIGHMVVKIRAKTSIQYLWNWVYGILRFICRTLETILRRLEVLFPRYGRKRLFNDFEIGFLAFAILFLEHSMLFCVDGGTIAKIQAKLFINRLWNWVYGIRRSILRTLEFILRWLEVVVKIRAKPFIRRLWNCVFSNHCSFFITLEVILPQLEIRFRR